jgi:hypothetical protein
MSVILVIVPVVVGTLAAPVVLAAEAVSLITDPKGESRRNVFDFPSVIRNKDLLHETLAKMGTQVSLSFQKMVGGKLDDLYVICSRMGKNKPFSIQISGRITQEKAVRLKDDLIAEYGNTVQNYVYETLKRKAEEKGLSLEKEVLQTDQSIVLTYNVG